MGRGGSQDPVRPGEQIEAFRERAAEIRAHPLFAMAEYSFRIGFRSAGDGRWEMLMAAGSRDQQHQFASLIRPLISQDDMISLRTIFKAFGRICTDQTMRAVMKDIKTDYERQRKSSLFSRTTPWRAGEAPGRWVSDREIGEAVLYGRLLHTNPAQRRLLNELGSLGDLDGDEHAAVMRLFHEAGSTALRVDDVLGFALEQNALKL